MIDDLTNEIKSLNIAIVKRLFSIKNKDNLPASIPSPLQFKIIDFLEENKDKDIYQKDLEKNLNVSKAAISGVIKTMEKKGIVERISVSNDARKNKIILSEKSLQIYHERIKDMKVVSEELISGISDVELQEFKRILNKMKENLRKEGE